MTRPLRHTLYARATSVALLAGCLSMCALSWGQEATPAEPGTTTAPASAATLTKLQGITNRASELAMRAFGMLGIHYKLGGNTPENGLDCSGFVRHVFQEAWGAKLPRTAAEISRVGQHIETQDLQPGDLVFYNTLKRGFSHVGIYLGDSKFIHAPSSGGEVRIDSMNMNYWKKRFNGARRIKDPEKQAE